MVHNSMNVQTPCLRLSKYKWSQWAFQGAIQAQSHSDLQGFALKRTSNQIEIRYGCFL